MKFIKHLFIIMLSVFAVNYMAIAQKVTVIGIVTDSETGESIPSVNIQIKGSTSHGTTTDIDGKYSITVNDIQDGVLVFSFIGYKEKEVPINNKTVLNVSLDLKAESLGEVVVVGYSTQTRSRLTSAVTTVNAKQIENLPVPNAIAAIQGAAPGVVVTRTSGKPGAEGYSMRVRGQTSTSGAPPLVIIDGVPGALTYVNPDDIESINILKDGSASAIYGSRAAGGVVIITTKKGNLNSKVKFEYNGLFSLDKPYGLPGRLNSWEEMDMQNIASINASNNPNAGAWSKQEMEWAKDPNVEYIPSGKDYLYYYNTDFNDLLIKKVSTNQTHNFSISGGTNKSSYRFSVGYHDKKGILKYGPDEYNRFNTLMKYYTKITKNISFDTQVTYFNSITKSSPRGTTDIFYDIYTTRRIYPLTAPNTDFAPNGGKGSGMVTYAVLKHGGKDESKIQQMQGTFNLSINNIIFPELRFRVTYSPRFRFINSELQKNVVPRYGVNGIVAYAAGYNQASLNKQRAQHLNQTANFLIDYNRLIDGHRVEALGGMLIEAWDYDNISATANDLFTTDPWSINFGDVIKNAISDNIQQTRLLSYIGRLNYSYKDKYLLEASFRYDGSSKLAPGKRWAFFPSISAGWNIAKESWYGDAIKNIFSDLKLRASWGKLGNAEGFGNYDYYAIMNRSGYYPFNNEKHYGYYQSALPAITRTWERIKTVNGGIDFGMFKNKLTASFDYYVKYTSGMFAVPSYPSTLGLSAGKENIAKMKTWGWEASIKWNSQFMLLNKPFNYNISLSVWDSNNKVTEYLAQKRVGAGTNGIIEGLPVNTIFGYECLGYFQSMEEVYPYSDDPKKMAPVPASRPYTSPGDLKYEDINGDGKINAGKNTIDDHGDLKNLGNTTPRYSFGFNLSIDWNGFDFSALIQGVAKRKMLINSNVVLPFASSWLQPYDIHSDYWREDNRDAKFPRPFMGSYNREVSTKWIQNASYVRLKNLQLGYTIPKSLTKKISVERLRIFFSGENLLEITGMNIKLFDPESPNNVSYPYPFYRSYSFGINLSF